MYGDFHSGEKQDDQSSDPSRSEHGGSKGALTQGELTAGVQSRDHLWGPLQGPARVAAARAGEQAEAGPEPTPDSETRIPPA